MGCVAICTQRSQIFRALGIRRRKMALFRRLYVYARMYMCGSNITVQASAHDFKYPLTRELQTGTPTIAEPAPSLEQERFRCTTLQHTEEQIEVAVANAK